MTSEVANNEVSINETTNFYETIMNTRKEKFAIRDDYEYCKNEIFAAFPKQQIIDEFSNTLENFLEKTIKLDNLDEKIYIKYNSGYICTTINTYIHNTIIKILKELIVYYDKYINIDYIYNIDTANKCVIIKVTIVIIDTTNNDLLVSYNRCLMDWPIRHL